jgi:hypothetical protein
MFSCIDLPFLKNEDEEKVEEKDRSGQDTIVNLSTTSKEFQTVREIITSEPDIREDKVQYLSFINA